MAGNWEELFVSVVAFRKVSVEFVVMIYTSGPVKAYKNPSSRCLFSPLKMYSSAHKEL